MSRPKIDRFMIISRLDYPSVGARRGLWLLHKHYAESEDVDVIIVAGGLTSHHGINNRIKEATNRGILEQKEKKASQADLPPDEREYVPTQVEVRNKVKERVLDQIATELADMLPVVNGRNKKPLKYYVTTSPAHKYDGPLGTEVVRRLARLRSDVIYWDAESARFELKNNEGKVLWILNPPKAPWRGNYYSTGAVREVVDKLKQTSQNLPDLFAVGCLGSAINQPAGGENPVPIITIPAEHKLQEVNTSENQVGITIVEFSSDRPTPLVSVYSFKDLVAQERQFISIPEGLKDHEDLSKHERDQRERQRAIFTQIVRDLPTIGMLEDKLRWQRSTIERDIQRYNESGFEPAIISGGDESTKYDVSREWLQYNLKYPMPVEGNMAHETMLSFCCLHAGYKHTQYKWFVNRLPDLIREYGVNALIGCGDLIAGLKHNLDRRDELLPGLNDYTKQEKYAAELVGAVILSVFKERFSVCLSRKRKKPTDKTIRKMILEALIYFFYWRGNHDEWVQDLGFEPLSTFRIHLNSYVVEGINAFLAENGLVFSGTRKAVENRIFYNKEHTMSSGLTLSIRHPHQGRMQTSSGRAQQTLGATPGQVVSLGNFHTHISVLEWRPESGQRLAVQAGTITSGTDFEYNMNKLVDTGVGISSVWFDSETLRIFKAAVVWDSPSDDEIINFDNEQIVSSMMDYVINS